MEFKIEEYPTLKLNSRRNNDHSQQLTVANTRISGAVALATAGALTTTNY